MAKINTLNFSSKPDIYSSHLKTNDTFELIKGEQPFLVIIGSYIYVSNFLLMEQQAWVAVILITLVNLLTYLRLKQQMGSQVMIVVEHACIGRM